ncbi:MAG: hypothetical protein HY815_02290 [Candidatus Riflebacteria bacterium]|nr:hypothetical protein [Candidatus Riflebacteria bacterium]
MNPEAAVGRVPARTRLLAIGSLVASMIAAEKPPELAPDLFWHSFDNAIELLRVPSVAPTTEREAIRVGEAMWTRVRTELLSERHLSSAREGLELLGRRAAERSMPLSRFRVEKELGRLAALETARSPRR